MHPTEKAEENIFEGNVRAALKDPSLNHQDRERAIRLSQAVKEAGGNKRVAEHAGLPVRSLTNFLNGRDMRSAELIALADACGVTAEWLASGRPPRRRPAEGEAVELEKVVSFREGPHLQAPHRSENSKYSVISSSNVDSSGHLAYKSRQIVEHFTFDTAWLIGSLKLTADKVFLADVWDDDMSPRFSLGDTVMIDTSWRETRLGEIYAIGQGDRIMLRRLVANDHNELLLADDLGVLDPIDVQPGEMFMPTLTDQKTLYFGRVVWHARSL